VSGRRTRHWRSSALEEKDRNLAKIKVDEVLRFMSYVGPEVATNNHMPRRTKAAGDM
jgi:hypothetical protein